MARQEIEDQPMLPTDEEVDESGFRDDADRTTSLALTGDLDFGLLRALVFGNDTFSTHLLPEKGEVQIGRSESADIRIFDPSISRNHAVLHVDLSRGNDAIEIQDLGSSNGTSVRGRRLEKDEKAKILIGEVIDLGLTMLVVQRAASSRRPRRLWSHGDFEVRLAEECERAKQSGSRFVLLRVRAEGRSKGTELEEILTGLLRPFDPIAAYAPGEYEALIVDSSIDDVANLKERIELKLQEHALSGRYGTAEFPQDGTRPEELVSLLGQRFRGVKHASEAEKRSIVVAKASAMEGLYRLVERVAASNISVLILGETGVGKEVMAEAVHTRSPRASKPFLRLNCAALTETLLESELFGHERGAFTGAVVAKPGLLETADGGTVFLDEVGELPLSTQVKLLRVLEERQVLRVGGLKSKAIDVRFISATNRNLEEEIARGGFRSDLYYRLNGISLQIPPLRDRPSEIGPLASAFAQHAREDAGYRGNAVITQDAMGLLSSYYWPGNIRELKNVIERAVLLAGDAPIAREHLPLEKLCADMMSYRPQPIRSIPPENKHLHRRPSGSNATWAPVPPPSPIGLEETLDSPMPDEKRRILEALDACGGNQTRAAKSLGMPRRTFISRLEMYNIPRPRKGYGEE